MACLDSPVVLWLLGIVQLGGLASAWLARLSEGSSSQAPCQIVFLMLLALIGGATMVSLVLGFGSWLAPGATMSIMVLAAIWDFRPHARAEGL